MRQIVIFLPKELSALFPRALLIVPEIIDPCNESDALFL